MAVLLLLVAIFATGCGGDDDGGSSITDDLPAATTTVAEDTPTDELPTEDDVPTAPEDTDVPENLEQGVEACKDSIDSNPSVSDDIKEDLKSICDKIGGDPEEIQEASREVCEKIVESSVPEGDIRDQAKEACASAGG
ncbi:MAG: hypothetical protein WKF96_21085 [Solirubrobacteraceae bacterium]